MFPELVQFCKQTVTIAPRTAVDSYGQPTYGAAVSYRVRVEGKRRLVRDDQGNEVVSTHAVYFALAPAVGAHDRITLSTGDVNSTEMGALQHKVVAVSRDLDDGGRSHVTAYLS